MAAPLSPNIDDGELFLPSDLYPDVEVHHPPELAYVEGLVQQLAAFRLLDRAWLVSPPVPAPKLPRRPSLEGFTPAPRFGAAEREVGSRFGYDGFRAPAARTGGYGTGLRRVYNLEPLRPVHVDCGLGQGRSRVSRSFEPNRWFYPLRRSGPSGKCVGTGVFLPRLVNNVADKHETGGRGQGRQLTRNAAEQGMSCHSPSEIMLPQDWSY